MRGQMLAISVPIIVRFATLTALCMVAACARTSQVGKPTAAMYAPERDPASSLSARMRLAEGGWSGATRGCSIFDQSSSKDTNLARMRQGLGPKRRLHLSNGDVVNILIPDGEEFNGDYTVEPNGHIALPFIPAVKAAGGTTQSVARRIEKALIRQNIMNEGSARVAVRVVRYSAIKVRVSGAVFQSGMHMINDPRGNKNESEIAAARATVRRYGDFTIRRTLTAAIRVASGVRPDADITRVQLMRDGQIEVLDLRGALTGSFVRDPVLENGDHIHVPPKGCFQRELVRPSAITPRGIRIFISKMHFAADSRYDEKMPYGLRLLNAAVVASCVGGTLPTRGRREILLRNPQSINWLDRGRAAKCRTVSS